jgi:hypothetical protein
MLCGLLHEVQAGRRQVSVYSWYVSIGLHSVSLQFVTLIRKWEIQLEFNPFRMGAGMHSGAYWPLS